MSQDYIYELKEMRRELVSRRPPGDNSTLRITSGEFWGERRRQVDALDAAIAALQRENSPSVKNARKWIGGLADQNITSMRYADKTRREVFLEGPEPLPGVD